VVIAPGPVAGSPAFPLPFITVPGAPMLVPPAPGTLIVVQAPVPPQMTMLIPAPTPVRSPAVFVEQPVTPVVATPVPAPAPYVAPVRPPRAFRN
jgi:hypothetical protein